MAVLATNRRAPHSKYEVLGGAAGVSFEGEGADASPLRTRSLRTRGIFLAKIKEIKKGDFKRNN